MLKHFPTLLAVTVLASLVMSALPNVVAQPQYMVFLVKDKNLNPIPAAEVVIFSPPPEENWVANGFTNASGYFIADISEKLYANYTVFVYVRNTLVAAEVAFLGEALTVIECDVTDLYINVQSEYGYPLSGITVHVNWSREYQDYEAKATSDSNGVATLKDMPITNYTISLKWTPTDFTIYTLNHNLAVSGIVDIRLPIHKLSCRALDEEGGRLDDVEFTISSEHYGTYKGQPSDGEYSVRVPSGSYQVIARYNDIVQERTVELSADIDVDFTFTTTKSYTLNIRVLYHDNSTASYAFIEVYDSSNNLIDAIQLGADAKASFKLPKGNYRIVARTPSNLETKGITLDRDTVLEIFLQKPPTSTTSPTVTTNTPLTLAIIITIVITTALFIFFILRRVRERSFPTEENK